MGYFFPNDFILLSFTIAQFGCVLMSWENILKNDKEEVEKFLSRGRRPFDMQARKDIVAELQGMQSERMKDKFYNNDKLPRLISKNLRQQMKADSQRDSYDVRISELPLNDKMQKTYTAFMQDEEYREMYLKKLKDMFGADKVDVKGAGFDTITFTLMPAETSNANYNY